MGFLDYDVEIRKIICSADAIESPRAHYRRAVRARGHFVTEQAALMCLYLVTRSPDRPDAAGSPYASMTTATMGARRSTGPAARWSTAIESGRVSTELPLPTSLARMQMLLRWTPTSGRRCCLKWIFVFQCKSGRHCGRVTEVAHLK